MAHMAMDAMMAWESPRNNGTFRYCLYIYFFSNMMLYIIIILLYNIYIYHDITIVYHDASCISKNVYFAHDHVSFVCSWMLPNRQFFPRALISTCRSSGSNFRLLKILASQATSGPKVALRSPSGSMRVRSPKGHKDVFLRCEA
jgi:hypothetical protein